MLHSTWTKPVSQAKTIQLFTQLALLHARESGDKRESLELLLQKGNLVDLLEFDLEINKPGWDPSALYHARQSVGLFKKIEELDVGGIDRKAKALDKFRDTERVCSETNRALRSIAPFLGEGFSPSVGNCPAANTPATKVPLPQFARLITGMRRKIKRVLRKAPTVAELQLRFGPGATTSTKKKDACPTHKFRDGLTCSRDLWASPYLSEMLDTLPHWPTACGSSRWGIRAANSDEWDDSQPPDVNQEILYELVTLALSSGRLGFVPKNLLTFRTTITEPVLNGMLQAAIGDWMADCLQVVGLDVRDQRCNAGLARAGSLFGRLATLDLRSASDLICYVLVKLLLPKDWFDLLCAARTGVVSIEGTEIVLEKFSSMGNGFTFPLETLIFWACTKTATELAEEKLGLQTQADLERTVSAYGDDIVCPTWAARYVVEALEACGFEVNTDKSYVSGPFRESCGTDCYNGFDVRPASPKHLLSGETAFTLHNFYVRRGLTTFADVVKSWIPRDLRIYGPDGYGDGHLVSDEWPGERSVKLARKGYGGISFDTFSRKPIKKTSVYGGDWVSPLYTTYVSGGSPIHIPDDQYFGRIGPFRNTLEGHFGEDPVGFPSQHTPRRRLGIRNLRRLARKAKEEPLAITHSKKGKDGLWRLEYTLPGSDGYRRTSIYTFA